MPDLNELATLRVVYTVPGMEQVHIRKNLTYKQLDTSKLQLDVYLPPDLAAETRLPAVLLVHGEAPLEAQPKEWGCFVSAGQILAASGLIGVTFNHRPSARYTRLHDAASDIDDLLGYLATHADTLQIDPDHIGLWVFSAGGPYGVRAAIGETRLHIRCVAAYYTVMDLQQGREQIPDVDDETVRQFSPAYLIVQQPEAVPPMLVARAGKDHPIINESLDRFVQAALASNITLDCLNHPEGRHGFDFLDAVPRSREIIKHTLDFFQTYLAIQHAPMRE